MVSVSLNDYVNKNDMQTMLINSFLNSTEKYCKMVGMICDIFLSESVFNSCGTKIQYYTCNSKLTKKGYCSKCCQYSKNSTYIFMLKLKIQDSADTVLSTKMYNEVSVKFLNVSPSEIKDDHSKLEHFYQVF